MGEITYKVYIKVNANSIVTAINSSAFVFDATEWIFIDKGTGDKYHHAQNLYLNKPLIAENGVYRYKFVDGKITERSAEEMAADIPEPAVTPPTNAELAEEVTALQIALCELYESMM